MRFKCHRTADERQAIVQKLKKWQPWFAWKPVRIGAYCYWLQRVERRFPGAWTPSADETDVIYRVDYASPVQYRLPE